MSLGHLKEKNKEKIEKRGQANKIEKRGQANNTYQERW